MSQESHNGEECTPSPPPVRRAAGAQRARYDGFYHVQKDPHLKCNFTEFTKGSDAQRESQRRRVHPISAAREARPI